MMMNAVGGKYISKIIEMRIKGEIIPYVKNFEFLLLDNLDGTMNLSISNKLKKENNITIMIVNSEEFIKEFEHLIKLKKQVEEKQ